MKKFFALTVVMLAFAASSFAQSSATASATATILTPIAISNTVDMDFGNLAGSVTPGTCVLATDNSRTPAGGVTIMAGGTPTAASFTVTGAADAVYTITLPGGATTVSNGTNTMTIDTWVSSPTPTGTLTLGTSTLLVGATLNVGISQAGGVYNTSNAGGSGEFTVTVNYQ
ncbi:MAG: DUF4402 domain-containing protein [Bacteroidales bacterium]|nr:DUF4402 domain-containing protein [Bacteroidales bacterium]